MIDLYSITSFVDGGVGLEWSAGAGGNSIHGIGDSGGECDGGIVGTGKAISLDELVVL